MKKIMIIILIAAVLIAPLFVEVNILTLEHYQAGRTILFFNISPGDEFTMRWTHSVELTPWEEIFRIDDEYNMILDRTRFQNFGAGVPDAVGTETYIEDGYLTYGGIDQIVPILPYGISDFAKHTFIFKDMEYKLYEMVPDGDRINIYTERINGYGLIARYVCCR
ncbi:hypothetical protein SAMN02745751_02465 [Dethiosulfatibacter aminovorans DSM 17477]|uniref:DUF1850 domain-containing protein n=1 Tax=Dethiosulfatibacter aminovorans DSM 17477 TaxID=1121476 RepID=A0A1M6IZ82_9FIRM|nr:DUF1850 domain-containing protein [Dethiosulfatibacter aminovorans]SHJ39775.1 hypothetical protein SAMN02745751_02465 [Dethiosulfatibacter aminovorans DSM 17477]